VPLIGSDNPCLFFQESFAMVTASIWKRALLLLLALSTAAVATAAGPV
jgi:hypothetical protein